MRKFAPLFIPLFAFLHLRVSAQDFVSQNGSLNQAQVSISMPMVVNINQTKEFYFKELGAKASSADKPNKVTMEMASTPVWYAIQALPSLVEYQNGSTVEILNSFFANSVALYLLNKEFRLDKALNEWEKDSSGLKNKNGSTNEENVQKKKIGRFFDTLAIYKNMDEALTLLEESQLPDGSWPWFHGMKGNRYVTQLMCCCIGRLFDMHIYDKYSDRLNDMGAKAFRYIDDEMTKDYNDIISKKLDIKGNYINSDIITYLYARTLWGSIPIAYMSEKALYFWQEQAWNNWRNRSLLDKATLIAAFYRQGEDSTYIKMFRAVDKEALHSEEMGTYWKENNGNDAQKTETQSMLLEAYNIMRYPTPDPQIVVGLKQLLLQWRQQDAWGTNAATADAIYALLQNDDADAITKNLPQIHVGDMIFDSTAGKGAGYLYRAWEGNNIRPELANINIHNGTGATAWGLMSMEYPKKGRNTEMKPNGLKIKKTVFYLADRNTMQWKHLSKNRQLKAGNSIKISFEMKAKKKLNFTHIQNIISPLTELSNTTTGVKISDGFMYEKEIKNGTIDFFIDHLEPRQYTISYTLVVKEPGRFQSGGVNAEKVY